MAAKVIVFIQTTKLFDKKVVVVTDFSYKMVAAITDLHRKKVVVVTDLSIWSVRWTPPKQVLPLYYRGLAVISLTAKIFRKFC